MTIDTAVLYAFLRDGLDWEGSRAGFALTADGALMLAGVPSPQPGAEIAQDAPFDVEPSGIVADGCGRIFVPDTAAHRIVVALPECSFRYLMPLNATQGNTPGQFDTPTGVALRGDTLYIADSGNARLQRFLLPAFELKGIVDTGLARPTGIAVDILGRIHVLDRSLQRIVRFRTDGSPDAVYNAAIGQVTTSPAFLALGADDTLYVSDDTTDANAVFVFDPDGTPIGALSLPARNPAVRPRAVAARGDMVLVADAASGTILVFDAATRVCIGSIPGFRAPVSAMVFDANGDLLVKTDDGDTYVRLRAGAGCVATGTIVAGPLDAGVQSDWERVAVDAMTPSGTSVTLETITRDAASPTPAEKDWRLSPSLDCLLARDPGPADPSAGKRRFLWVRVTLHSTAGRASPTLAQVQAQTIGDSYLDQLPRIYRRDDRDTRFLERWLALFRSGIEDRESAIELMPRRFDPAMAPAEQLRWLAQSLAFDPPQSLTPLQLRALLARIPQLYAQRGTIAGVAALAEIYTGIRPKIIEAYHARRVWQLDETSRLGFDTALAAATPEGFVVPRDARTDLRYAGLHGAYYRGTDFDELVRSGTDATIPAEVELTDDKGMPIKPFSVRWSGQIRPRFSETYALHVKHYHGARLWIDGRQLIDEWTGRSSAQVDPRIVLDAARWHAIQLEVLSLGDKTPVSFVWSSRSQRPEAVPGECLYSVLDEHADLTAPQGAAFDVGHAVVGESGPLAASEFGSTLFTDYAHLFTVVAPAGSCCERHRRDELREIIDAEKPAHTDYHLCFAEPRMRVGFQARLGIDAIIASGPPPLRLDDSMLGRNAVLG